MNHLDMERNDDQQLWDLLGKTAAPKVSPFFARDVVRRVRELPTWKTRLAEWLSIRRLLPLTTAAAAVLAVALLLHGQLPSAPPPATHPSTVESTEDQDAEVSVDIDDLNDDDTASDDDSLYS